MTKKSEIIFKKIKKASNIFIMGHKNLDLDALGACVGMTYICKKLRKTSYIILQDKKHDESIKKALSYLEGKNTYNFIKYSEALNLLDEESLCIIVDTYSEKRTQSYKLASKINNKLIIDHHLFGKPISRDYIIDTKVSSTCELFYNIFKNKNLKIDKYCATLLLSGIILDTNNFSMKTTVKTLDTVKYLFKRKADNILAHSFFKTNMNEYQKIQKVIFKTEFYNQKYAFVKCNRNQFYDTEDLAKICDTLLMFDNVEVAFAIGYINEEEVGCSARSIKINVASIMKKFGGGGHKYNAACLIKNKTIDELTREIKEEI